MRKKKGYKIVKILIVVVVSLFFVTGCDNPVEFKKFKGTNVKTRMASDFGTEYYCLASDSECLKSVWAVFDIDHDKVEWLSYEQYCGGGLNQTLVLEKKNINIALDQLKLPEMSNECFGYTYTFRFYDKDSVFVDALTEMIWIQDSDKIYTNSSATQSIQTGVEPELLEKIGGTKEYCNYDATLHYNELPSSANMFSKIAYSQVNCATTKYSSSYDNGISFINWVFEKNGASTRLPSTYNEVITWAGNKIFTADAKGTNIQAGDLVILGNDSTSPIEIVVQVNSNRIKTVGYKTSGNNKVIYETSHSDMLNGKRIIKMSGVSY